MTVLMDRQAVETVCDMAGITGTGRCAMLLIYAEGMSSAKAAEVQEVCTSTVAKAKKRFMRQVELGNKVQWPIDIPSPRRQNGRTPSAGG